LVVVADSHLAHVMHQETQNEGITSNRLTLFGDPFWEKTRISDVQLVNRPELELFGATEFTKSRRFHSFYAFYDIV
jgi:hypothetical protein